MLETTGLGEALSSPPDAKADIVFVHGLGGHRVQTWTSKPTEETPFERFWPKDFLPSACPKARILSFGYDSSFAHFYPVYGPKNIPVGTTIDDHSAALFLALNNFRVNTRTPPDRPLFFIAHSLGGLVVANALSRPVGANDEDAKLVDATAGAIFLGTPFEGSSKARWGSLGLQFAELFSATNKHTVKDLQERSQRLTTVNDSFYKLIKARDQSKKPLNIACFYEEWPTYVLVKKVGIIVPKESATLSGINPIPIAASHSGMCKFADESRSGYRAVSGLVIRWIKELEGQPASKRATKGTAHSGDMIFQGSVNNSGVLARDVEGYTPDAVRLTGSINYYGSGYAPKGSQE